MSGTPISIRWETGESAKSESHCTAAAITIAVHHATGTRFRELLPACLPPQHADCSLTVCERTATVGVCVTGHPDAVIEFAGPQTGRRADGSGRPGRHAARGRSFAVMGAGSTVEPVR